VKEIHLIAVDAAKALIDAYRENRADGRLAAAWESMCSIVDAVEIPDDPDEDHPIYVLCYRLAYALEHEGFDADDDENEDLIAAAAHAIYEQLPDERTVLDQGKKGELHGGGFLTVDLVTGKVIASDEPVTPNWARPVVRAGPKVGRNDPCPCGSGKKYKKCCGAA